MHKAVRLWPPIGVVAMLLLGWAVGRRSTAVDDGFQRYRHSPARWLLFFTDPRVLTVVLAVCIGVALYQRRWRLTAAAALAPALAIVLVELSKRLFGREKGGALCYPSGHATVAVVVLGMAVLVAGVALWAVLVAVASCVLGMLGQAVTYHYFTDTVGALLVGTAIVCVVAWVVEPT
jgi:membrane-associated phospholipid phosphatase